MISVYEIRGEYWTDLDVNASELWVVAGFRPFVLPDDTTHGGLPDGFRWVSDSEWEGNARFASVNFDEAMLLAWDKQQDAVTERLAGLGLPSELSIDESGQTSHEEHVAWLLAASDEEIRLWTER